MKTIGSIAGAIALLSLLTGISAWELILVGIIFWILLGLSEVWFDSNGSLDKRWRMWREKRK